MMHEILYFQDEQYSQKALGTIICLYRKKQNLSLCDLAKELNLSTQYLHEIEKGKKKGSNEVYQTIFDFLGIKFYDDLTLGTKYEGLFNEMIDAYIDMEPKKREQIGQKILTDPYIQTSYFFPIYYLAKFVHDKLIKNQDEAKEDIFECENVYCLFNKNQRAIYFYFRGMHASQFEKNKAYDYFNRSLEESSSCAISAMANYMIGAMYTKIHNFAKAIDYLNLSKDLLIKQNHFHRTVYPTIVLGIVYCKMRQATLMEKYLLSASKIALQYNDKKNYFISMEDIAFGYLRLCNYDQCIRYSLQLLQEGYTDYYLYYSLAWSYYMKGNKIKAAKYRDLLVKHNKHEYLDVDNYEICLNYLLVGKYEAYFKKLKKYYETCKHKNPIEDNEVLLERLVAYCDQNNLVEEGYYYQKEYIKLLKKS